MAEWEAQLDALKATIAALQQERDALAAEKAALIAELADFRAMPVIDLKEDTIVRIVPPEGSGA